MKKYLRSFLVALFIVCSCTSFTSTLKGKAAVNPYIILPDTDYDTSLWDKTEYTEMPYIVNVGLNSHPSLILKITPVIYQSTRKIDDRVFQCVSYTMEVQSQKYYNFKYIPKTIDVRLSEILSDTEMFAKDISPLVSNVPSSNNSYAVEVGESFEDELGFDFSKEGVGISIGFKDSVSSKISNEVTCVDNAVYCIPYSFLKAYKEASWEWRYKTNNLSSSTVESYICGPHIQMGAIAWAGKENVNYYYSNFRFQVFVEALSVKDNNYTSATTVSAISAKSDCYPVYFVTYKTVQTGNRPPQRVVCYPYTTFAK